MEEKILTEIESKDYLLEIAENKISRLEKELKKQSRNFQNYGFISFPLVIIGLLSVIEKIEQDPSLPKLFLFMILAVIIFIGLVAFLGWIFEKIKDSF